MENNTNSWGKVTDNIALKVSDYPGSADVS